MLLTIQGVRGSRRAVLYHVVQGRESPSTWLSVGCETMKRTSRFGGMLVAAGVALWCEPRPLALAQEGSRSRGSGRGQGARRQGGEVLPRISLLSLQVTRPLPAAADMPPGMLRPRRFGVQRFGMQQAPGEGTTLTFLVEEPQQSMIGLEMKDCKITKFCDDKNTDLTKVKERARTGRGASDSRGRARDVLVLGRSRSRRPSRHDHRPLAPVPRQRREPAAARRGAGREVWPRREGRRAEGRQPESRQDHGGTDPHARDDTGPRFHGPGSAKSHAGRPSTISGRSARSRRSPSSTPTARRSSRPRVDRGGMGPIIFRSTTRSRRTSRPAPSASPCPKRSRP